MQKTYYFLLFLFINIAVHGQTNGLESKLSVAANELATKIRKTGKTKVGIADFNDLQGNVPELGKFLAETFQGEMVNQGLRVINRQRLSQILIENKLTAQRLVDPDKSVIVGRAARMEVIIIGTITPVDDKVLSLNLLGLDVEGAEAIASAKTTFNRTAALDVLLRTVVGTVSSEVDPVSPSSKPRGEYEKELPKSQCEDGRWGYGGICFENRFAEPVLLKVIKSSGLMDIETNVLIAAGAEGCAPPILLSTRQFGIKTFYFETLGSTKKEGFITQTINRCKEKHISLTPSNFNFSIKK
jgi:hypothetical protein